MRYRLALYLDEARLARLRGSPLEGLGLEVLRRFPSARVDARGFIEDVPVSFRRALLEELMAGLGVEEGVRRALERVRGGGEEEFVPPP